MYYKPIKTNAVLLFFVLLTSGLATAEEITAWQMLEGQTQQIFELTNPYVVGISVRTILPVVKSNMISSPATSSDPNGLRGLPQSPEGTFPSALSVEEKAGSDYLESLLSRERVATGLVVDAAGHILTTASVLRGATDVQAIVTFADGTKQSAELVADDPFSNLALFKVDRTFTNIPAFGQSDELKIGSMVLAIARPYGRSNSLFIGTISNLAQELGQARYESLIQTTLPLHPGSIGSPLLNFKGQIVGLLSTTQKQSSWPEISFAIPSEMLEHITQDLIDDGKVTRGFLGVWVNPITNQSREEMSIPADINGMIVNRVDPGNPADKAGIKQGDIITHFNEKPVNTYQQLIWHTSLAQPGTEIPIEIWREGESQIVWATLQEYKMPLDGSNKP